MRLWGALSPHTATDAHTYTHTQSPTLMPTRGLSISKCCSMCQESGIACPHTYKELSHAVGNKAVVSDDSYSAHQGQIAYGCCHLRSCCPSPAPLLFGVPMAAAPKQSVTTHRAWDVVDVRRRKFVRGGERSLWIWRRRFAVFGDVVLPPRLFIMEALATHVAFELFLPVE